MRNNSYREIDVIIGRNIKRLTKRDKITRKDLTEILQISKSQLYKYESGRSCISSIYLYLLAKYFDVSMEEFFEEDYPQAIDEEEGANRS